MKLVHAMRLMKWKKKFGNRSENFGCMYIRTSMSRNWKRCEFMNGYFIKKSNTRKFHPYCSLILYSETNYALGMSNLISVSSMGLEDLIDTPFPGGSIDWISNPASSSISAGRRFADWLLVGLDEHVLFLLVISFGITDTFICLDWVVSGSSKELWESKEVSKLGLSFGWFASGQ